jgi:hypothetical protein
MSHPALLKRARISLMLATGLAIGLAAFLPGVFSSGNGAALAQQPCSDLDDERCLFIIKETDPSDSSEDFTFEVEIDASPEDDETLEDGEFFGISYANADEIEITENSKTGWMLESIECSQEDGVEINEDERRVTVTRDEAVSSVTCTFTNVKVSTPTATATATGTPTATPTGTVTPTSTPSGPPHLGAIVGGGPRATATPQPTQVPQGTQTAPIRPPSTGDGGIR